MFKLVTLQFFQETETCIWYVCMSQWYEMRVQYLLWQELMPSPWYPRLHVHFPRTHRAFLAHFAQGDSGVFTKKKSQSLKKQKNSCTIYTGLIGKVVIKCIKIILLKYNEAVIVIHNFWILRSNTHLGKHWSATRRHTFLSGYHCRDRNTPSQAAWGTSSYYRHRNTHCRAGGENTCRIKINKVLIHYAIYMHVLYELISNAIN